MFWRISWPAHYEWAFLFLTTEETELSMREKL